MVRIVKKDFWTNYDNYEDVIRRCFSYLYSKKFPSNEPQGMADSYDHLLVEFNRLNVFGRFNKELPNLKVATLEKKFEQHLYKWSEHILSMAYHDRRKRTLRFRRISNLNDIHRDTFDKKHREEIFADDVPSLDVEQLPTKAKKEALRAQAKVDRLYKKYPTVEDIPVMTSEKYETPVDNLIEEDTWNLILAACRDEKERTIVRLKKEGLTSEDIGVSFNCSGSNISSILSQIKGRFKRRALQAA